MMFNEQTGMSADETDAFLGHHETGVLSLARDSDPYAIPISYGFDRGERQFYLRLVSTPESEKRSFLASSPASRLVVYEEAETTYRSAVVIGTLERIEPDDLTPETIEQYGDTRRPLFEIWSEGTRDLEIELYRLVPDEINGRHIEFDRDEE
ncbi:MAG: pyridoxamine 5'-phosphate oxidase family protein [Halolamina sp.]|uniref:pyridoxamine 5'-phosphate oxidase family protein n=1 Tax=Halolamina sp. TaxID=1940283 RepID=UPI002FC3AA21